MNKRSLTFLLLTLLLYLGYCQQETDWQCKNSQLIYDARSEEGMYKSPPYAIFWHETQIIAKRVTTTNFEFTVVDLDSGSVVQRKILFVPKNVQFLFQREYIFFFDIDQSIMFNINFNTQALSMGYDFGTPSFSYSDIVVLCKVGKDSLVAYPLDKSSNFYYNYTTKTTDFSDFSNPSAWTVNYINYDMEDTISYYCADEGIYTELKSGLQREFYKVRDNKAQNLKSNGLPYTYQANSGGATDGRYIYMPYYSDSGDGLLYRYDRTKDEWQEGPTFLSRHILSLAYDVEAQTLYVLVENYGSVAFVFLYNENLDGDFSNSLSNWRVWERSIPFNTLRSVFIYKGFLYVLDDSSLIRYKCVDSNSITIADLNFPGPFQPDPAIISQIYIGLKKCGDGYVNILTDEECDDSNTNNFDGCNSDCKVESGWICENFYYQYIHLATAYCRRIIAGCGNGVVDAEFEEQCDDNNVRSGDGCSSTCQVECGYTCDLNVRPSFCVPIGEEGICGDGIIQNREKCDKPTNGFGCDNDRCEVKDGYKCSIKSNILECGPGCLINKCSSECDDIDECSSRSIIKPCGKNAVCHNNQGSFTCECPAPLTGDPYQFCILVDHCKNSPCQAGLNCISILNGYICSDPCPKGFYTENGVCVDIDECALANELNYNPVFNCIGRDCNYCDSNAICSNTHGSFACSCKTGFVGDGFLCAAMDCTNKPEGTRCVLSDYSSGTCNNLTESGDVVACGGCILDADDCDIAPYSGVFNPITCSCETVATPCGAIGTFPSGSCCSPLLKDSNGRCQYPWCKVVNDPATYFSGNSTSNCCIGLVNVTLTGNPLKCKVPTLLKSECKIVNADATSSTPCCKGLKFDSVKKKCVPSLTMCNTKVDTNLSTCCYGSTKNSCNCYCPVGFYV